MNSARELKKPSQMRPQNQAGPSTWESTGRKGRRAVQEEGSEWEGVMSQEVRKEGRQDEEGS